MNAIGSQGTSERTRCAAQILTTCVVALISVNSHSQPVGPDYPARPVRLIVPNAVGGPTDISARIVAQKLTQLHGQQFIVENHILKN